MLTKLTRDEMERKLLDNVENWEYGAIIQYVTDYEAQRLRQLSDPELAEEYDAIFP